jgi:DNA-binding response OmpR family regulator
VRVLVVSEDVGERLRAVSGLRLHDVGEVVEVASAEEARDLLLHQGEHFDVLVVDGDLSPRGGFAMLYDLRNRDALHSRPSAPAVVLAAREQDRWLGAWAGANEVVLKPVDPFDLARRVAGLAGEIAPVHGDRGSAVDQVAAAVRDHTSRRATGTGA